MDVFVNEKLKENYRKSLKQKYNAVCLDIDGTLTEEDSKHIDKRVIALIADLLQKRVPVLFITGRGETGLNEMLKEIEPVLRNEYNLDNNHMSRMYALLNDGARLFKTTGKSKRIFDDREYLASAENFDFLKYFNNEIKEYFYRTKLRDYCDITYSFDSKDNRIVNMRFNLKTNDKKIIERIYNIIEELIRDSYPSLTITKGIYEGKVKIQIGTVMKDYAIEKAERLIGVPKDSMLRLGDCGSITGNDYSMLNCAQGFSVKETSGKVDCCFPVMDNNYNILTGVEATIFLLKNAKILPTICLESADKDYYKKEYSLIEKMINIGRNQYLSKYNAIFNEALDLYNGINGVFDPDSGSVIIPMYEWELIEDDNPLKKFFEKRKNNNFSYILRDNQNIMLRGSTTYYYFLANRFNIFDKRKDKEIDFTSKDNVESWFNNYSVFIKESINALLKSNDLNDIVNKKMILGILDNIRNILLILINANINTNYDNNNSLIINLESLPEEYGLRLLYDNLL